MVDNIELYIKAQGSGEDLNRKKFQQEEGKSMVHKNAS